MESGPPHVFSADRKIGVWKVFGSATDTVTLSGGFAAVGRLSDGGVDFDVYGDGEATILVEIDVAVTLFL